MASDGTIFLADGDTPGVQQLDAAGQLQQATDTAASEVLGLSLDSHGHLAVLEHRLQKEDGAIYSETGTLLSRFVLSAVGNTSTGAALSATGEKLYVAEPGEQMIEGYKGIVFPESRTCAAENVTSTTAQLCGELNPDGISTRAFFRYGTTPALAQQSATVFQGTGEAFMSEVARVEGLKPNQTYYYDLGAEAQVEGEPLLSEVDETASFHTPGAPAKIGLPSAAFVGTSTAVISAQIDPEHATTTYHFEYGSCASLAGCPGVQSTQAEESSQAGELGASRELSGLASGTLYSYRLVAESEFEEAGHIVHPVVEGAEGQFTTAPQPTPTAVTGGASSITATGAVLSGEVNSEGPAATYLFELGVYAGTQTRYGVVASGSVAGTGGPTVESASLASLQPNVTYAFRIAIGSGYLTTPGQTAFGAPVVFTTSALPALLGEAPLALLPLPPLPAAHPAQGRVLPVKVPMKKKEGRRKPKRKRKRGDTHIRRRTARRTRPTSNLRRGR